MFPKFPVVNKSSLLHCDMNNSVLTIVVVLLSSHLEMEPSDSLIIASERKWLWYLRQIGHAWAANSICCRLSTTSLGYSVIHSKKTSLSTVVCKRRVISTSKPRNTYRFSFNQIFQMLLLMVCFYLKSPIIFRIWKDGNFVYVVMESLRERTFCAFRY